MIDESFYAPSEDGAIRQGEIISNLTQVHLKLGSAGIDPTVLLSREHPWAIVLSQDCDLVQDYRCRFDSSRDGIEPTLPNILFCEVVTADVLKSKVRASKVWERIEQNKDERYQFLESVPAECDALSEGIVELGVDFKRHFTIPNDEVYVRLRTDARRRCKLISPYTEHLSDRFAFYLGRIGLPRDHFSE